MEAVTISQESQTRGYVRALDGVRGIAVVLVLLFHLEVVGFGAGFLGVDVFFVLSGFLITSLLLGDIARTGSVSLPGFWARRVRRLAPALVIVLLVVAAVAWLSATPLERASERADLLASTAYVANWHFISTTSYFDSSGLASPLQHFWSLAIEEQFYLVWPLVIAGIVLVFRRRHLAIAVAAGFAAIVSMVLLGTLWNVAAPERAYMGTDARVFEPLIGALGAVLMTTAFGRRAIERLGTPLAVVGALGLVVTLAVIRPGGWAYFHGGAVAAALFTLALVAGLWVGAGGGLRRGLEWKPLVWLGAISYGVYLWHWPIIVWLGGRDAEGWARLGTMLVAIVLTLVVSALSFYLVEDPIRKGRWSARRGAHRPVWERRMVLASVPVALLMVACVSIAATSVPEIDARTPVIMLAGDSVPEHLELALEEAALARGWRLVSAAHGGCSVTAEPLADVQGNELASKSCGETVVAEQDALIDEVDPDVVLWWDRWSLLPFVSPSGDIVEPGSDEFWRLRTLGLEGAVDRLGRDGARIVFVGVEPPGLIMEGRCQEDWCPGRFLLRHYDDLTRPWNSFLQTFAREHPERTTFLSVTDQVCQFDRSPCDDTIEGVSARPDGVHYEGAGEDLIVSILLARAGQALPAAAPA